MTSANVSIRDVANGIARAGGIPSRGLRPAAELAADLPHGVRLRYLAGCKCFQCRRSNSDYERRRQAARSAGDWNGIVSAAKARAHIQKLSAAGVGRRSICASTDLSDSIVHAIKTGAKARIRARTERLILAVSIAQAADRAHIPAARTWRQIEELLAEGFTKRKLASLLGYRAKTIQFKRHRVTARNAAKVNALYRRFMT